MNNKAIFYVIGAIIIIGGGIYFYQMPASAPAVNNEAANNTTPTNNMPVPDVNIKDVIVNEEPAAPINTDTPTANLNTPKIQTFNVSASNFTFSLKEMRVKKGDTVKVVFTNTSGFHDWVIDEFKTRTPQISAGQTSTVEFVANKTGTFEYYCSVGSHRAMGMKGNLIVE